MTTLSRRQLLRASGVGAAALALPRLPSALAATATAAGIAGDPLGPGYWILWSNGVVEARGSARDDGGAPAFKNLGTGIAAYPSGRGFWRVAANGRTNGFGSATTGANPRENQVGSVVGIAAHHSGDGFWRVTNYGKVQAAGVRHLGGAVTHYAITGLAAHPEASGYWILNRSGRVFARGASRQYGTACGLSSVGIAPHPGGEGYWIVKASGQVHAYGEARHYGNASLATRVVDIAAAPDGLGYWILAADGTVRAFGSARSGIITTSAVPEPDVTTVGGIVVATTIAPQVRRLLAAAADVGIKFGGGGYRSHATQIQLRRNNCGPRYYDIYVKPSSECSPMTAVPGRSQHEKGLAIDFYRILRDGSIQAIAGTPAFTWLRNNARRFGLYNLPSEPWHWSTTGN